MELKKSLVEHMVHLLSCGHVLPVVDYISRCMQMGSLDQSHIRHFVSEVLSVIQRPYSPDFSTAFEPLVHNQEITAPLINPDKTDPVSVFIGESYIEHTLQIVMFGTLSCFNIITAESTKKTRKKRKGK